MRDVSQLPSVAEAEDKESALSALIAGARALLGEDTHRSAQDLALDFILDDIRDDLSEFGVADHRWYSEHSLTENGAIDRALAKLQANNHTYRKGGATCSG